MKITYSSFESKLRRQFKKANKGVAFNKETCDSQILECRDQLLSKCSIPKRELFKARLHNNKLHKDYETDRILHQCILQRRYFFETHHIRHYFLNSHPLCEFLETSVKSPSAKELCNLMTEDADYCHICVHFPTSYMKYSALLEIDKKYEKYYSMCAMQFNPDADDNFIFFRAEDSIDLDFSNQNNMKLVKIIFGLCYYIKCFPESVSEGFPENGKNPNHYRKFENFSVSPVKEIAENPHSVSPHFRNGHFRYLQSEKYKKKRFQVVFVRECFVGGEVKTVNDEFENNKQEERSR